MRTVSAERRRAEGDERASVPANVLRALVVEQSTVLRQLLSAILEANGFDCVEASDGVDALKFASTCGIDLIVTDLEMPRMGGLELLSLASRGVFGEAPPPAIICMPFSIASTPLAAIQAMTGLPVAALQLPLRPADVADAIETAFARSLALFELDPAA